MEIATEAILYEICRRLRERGDEAVTGADNSKNQDAEGEYSEEAEEEEEKKNRKRGVVLA